MTENHFWQIVQRACRSDSRASNEWSQRLVDELSQLPADEIIEWNHLFDRLVAQACTIDLMAACYIINTGAGDDGFYYFRGWLVGMGSEIYYRALHNADTLVEVVFPYSAGVDAEAGIYHAAHDAWMRVTGNPDTAPYPARNESATLTGEGWDFDDNEEMRKRLPRLTAFYGDDW